MFYFVQLLSKQFLVVVKIINLIFVATRLLLRLTVRQLDESCFLSGNLSVDFYWTHLIIIAMNLIHFSD